MEASQGSFAETHQTVPGGLVGEVDQLFGKNVYSLLPGLPAS